MTKNGRCRRFFFHGKIPLWIKLLYTCFVSVLVPVYWWQYTPVNFLWFCDVALLTTLVAMWLESSLLASMQAIAILSPQLLWQFDFLVHLATGISAVGVAAYMFDATIPLYIRGLSLFHGWLPIVLVWLIWRLGYDRRALFAQTLYGSVILLLSYAFTTDIHGPAGNVNKIYGWSDKEPQTWMPPWLWLTLLVVLYPVCIYGPTHFLFRRIFSPAKVNRPS